MQTHGSSFLTNELRMTHVAFISLQDYNKCHVDITTNLNPRVYQLIITHKLQMVRGGGGGGLL